MSQWQVGERVRHHALAFVGDRDRDMRAVVRRRHPDGATCPASAVRRWRAGWRGLGRRAARRPAPREGPTAGRRRRHVARPLPENAVRARSKRAPDLLRRGIHRPGFDQRLEVGLGAPLVAVRARVGNGGCRLLREKRQQRLVAVREPAVLLREEEAAHGRVPVTHGHAQQGPAGDRERGAAERAGVVCQVRQSAWHREAAQSARRAGARRATRPAFRVPPASRRR